MRHTRRVIVSKPKRSEGPYRDPYAPSSPDYAERHRTTSYEIAPGIVRTDIG